MQLRTESSEAIVTAFNNMTTAYVRQLAYTFKVAWTRVEGSVSYATVGTSLIGGMDILQGISSVVTGSDFFFYYDETDRLISFEYDRVLLEPLGGIATCVSDCKLNNFDSKFTPNQNATIGTAILPNRPVQTYLGFLVNSINKTVPVFKGLSKMPNVSRSAGIVSMGGVDFVKFLETQKLDGDVYVDKRGDEIIEDILTTIGFGTSQYSLDISLNTIPFAAFNKDQSAFERIRLVCEAEEAFFYQDEKGVLRFENRQHFQVPPFNASVWDIKKEDIISWKELDTGKLINSCTVKSKPREEQATADIWTSASEVTADAGATVYVWARLEDPATEVTAPASTTDFTAFTQTGGAGTNITSDQTVTADLLGTDVKFTITNASGAKAYFNLFKIRGKSATVVGEILETYTNTASVDKYDLHELVVDNNFIQDQSFAQYLANSIVDKYGEPLRLLELYVQGIPHLQLRDRVKVTDPDLNTSSEYRVVRIRGILEGGGYTQYLTLREISATESAKWSIIGSSVVGDTSEGLGI